MAQCHAGHPQALSCKCLTCTAAVLVVAHQKTACTHEEDSSVGSAQQQTPRRRNTAGRQLAVVSHGLIRNCDFAVAVSSHPGCQSSAVSQSFGRLSGVAAASRQPAVVSVWLVMSLGSTSAVPQPFLRGCQPHCRNSAVLLQSSWGRAEPHTEPGCQSHPVPQLSARGFVPLVSAAVPIQ